MMKLIETGRHATLGDLIALLKSKKGSEKITTPLLNPHSYRGYYEYLAFEMSYGDEITVKKQLEIAKKCLGKTFIGWKGGEFTMSEETYIYAANKGNIGHEIIGYRHAENDGYGYGYDIDNSKPVIEFIVSDKRIT